MGTHHKRPIENERSLEAAIRRARSAVLIAFCSVGVVTAMILVERIVAIDRLYSAANEAREIARINSGIILSDEILTMSAAMAAHSGDPRWVERYAAEVPIMDGHIEQAMELAPTDIANRFDADTRLANDALVAMEWEALALVDRGDLKGAQDVFERNSYWKFKDILSNGSAGFSGELQRAFDVRVSDIRERTLYEVLLVGAITLLLLFVFHRRFDHAVNFSRKTHRDQADRITALETIDEATGLANLSAYRTEIAKRLEQDAPVCAAVITLNNVSRVKDRAGLEAMNQVRKQVGARLSSVLGDSILLAHISNDEFALLTSDDADMDDTLTFCLDAILLPITAGGIMFQISAGAGYAIGAEGEDPDQLIHKAATAARDAVLSSSSRPVAHTHDMYAEMSLRRRIISELPDAIKRGEIVPFFQPTVELETDRVIGFEVLARWEHPQEGLLGPDKFIPHAIEEGLINELFYSILKQGAQVASTWPDIVSIAVNLTPNQIAISGMADSIFEIVREAGLPPDRLVVEITEDAVISDVSKAHNVIRRLKDAGVRLALDDFGTGYSSLHNLQILPFDKIKIDRSFVQIMATNPDAAKLVYGIIGLGNSLHMPITAEGVESAEIASLLRAAGCSEAQGWHYGKPMPALKASELLMKQESRSSAPQLVTTDLPRVENLRPAAS